ncbi:DUF1800 domain-containing protein [Desertibaculum subflavum]|uniref:DUF1800 domain-containing protein n=1 Tax=Desertibaculum subflavum TaxID=2268458 RepID=UPI000E663364
MRSGAAIIAANRFGLGARAAEVPLLEADPRGWLLRQIDMPGEVPAAFANLASGNRRAGEYMEAVAARRAAGLEDLLRRNGRQVYGEEAGARFLAAVRSPQSFRERLVAFWSNHLTVSVLRPAITFFAGAYEREAIRPHVTGRFADMLVAACAHPAMLLYLDNHLSVGPNSESGVRSRRGLNENLAREILELHTVGVAAGYSQDDVRALAKMITGWGLLRPNEGGTTGAFTFRARAHEPGEQTLLGCTFAAGGYEQGEAALTFLATHPATARHIATKLARHFAGDDPPTTLVDRLAMRFVETGGDLLQVARALVEAPEPWAEIAPKLRTPFELQVAAYRALGIAPAPDRVLGSLAQLGHPMFRAPSPAGWPDRAKDWAGPEALVKRIEWAVAVAERVRVTEAPTAILERALGPAAGDATRFAVARAESGREGLALLLASPEFQRR